MASNSRCSVIRLRSLRNAFHGMRVVTAFPAMFGVKYARRKENLSESENTNESEEGTVSGTGRIIRTVRPGLKLKAGEVRE